MSLFSQKIETFGLDFSDLSLKIAKLEKRANGFRLSSFGDAEMSPGIIDSGEVKNPEALSDCIKKAVANVQGDKLKTRYVVCSLPEEKSFLDTLLMPQLKEDEFLTAVMFEAENHIPLPLSEVYFDFEKIGNTTSQKQQEVLIAATPKAVVDGYLTALKKAGLQPAVMEIECLSIARALVGKEMQDKPFLIVDLGANKTSFLIFSDRCLRFTSTVAISGCDFTRLLAKKLKISFQEAEQMKLQEGLEGNREISEVAKPVLAELAEQIKTHLEYFAHSLKQLKKVDVHVEKILLCGGGANLKGLINFLSRNLGIKIELGNPWINILEKNLKEVPILPFEQSLGYTTALGLALRGAN